MISPETLRRYPIFGILNEQQLRILAMHTEEKTLADQTQVFTENEPAKELYFLIEGEIDLFNIIRDPLRPDWSKEFHTGEVNPGELFGVSSFIKPHLYTNSAKTTKNSKILIIDAVSLRNPEKENSGLDYLLLHQVAQQLLERLNLLRIQIAKV